MLMKKYTLFFLFCLLSLFAAITAFAQQGPTSQFGYGFTGPQGSSARLILSKSAVKCIVEIGNSRKYMRGFY